MIDPQENMALCIGDVVEYYLLAPVDGRNCGIGVITDSKQLHPLCFREASSEELYYDHAQKSLHLSKVRIKNIFENVIMSQRIVEDRISNPHGEHAEELFILPNGINLTGIYIPVVDSDH